MTITPDDLARIARLAELDVAPTDQVRLAGQLDAIVGYVGQLAELAEDAPARDAQTAAGAVLRDDTIDRIQLAHDVEAMAPEFRDGFFVVPRLPAMDG